MSKFLKIPFHFFVDQSGARYLLLFTLFMCGVSGVSAQDNAVPDKEVAHYIILIRDSSILKYNSKEQSEILEMLRPPKSVLAEFLLNPPDTHSTFRAIQPRDRVSIVLAAAHADAKFEDVYNELGSGCPTHGTWRNPKTDTNLPVEPDQYFKFVPGKKLLVWQKAVDPEKASSILSFDPCFFGDGFSSEYAYRAVLDWMPSDILKDEEVSQFFIIVVDFVRSPGDDTALDDYDIMKLREAANRANLTYQLYYISTYMPLNGNLAHLDSDSRYATRERWPESTQDKALELRFRVYGAERVVNKVMFDKLVQNQREIAQQLKVAKEEIVDAETQMQRKIAENEMQINADTKPSVDRLDAIEVKPGILITLLNALQGSYERLALKAEKKADEELAARHGDLDTLRTQVKEREWIAGGIAILFLGGVLVSVWILRKRRAQLANREQELTELKASAERARREADERHENEIKMLQSQWTSDKQKMIDEQLGKNRFCLPERV